ncbi:hypothetical protein [Rhodococcus sp. BP22]|uniref:hypothetical protein n=1 Tax=Rhodococcus sp. BP22 TaxID=2758566 RepID=UPI00164842BB|nr:hypothetical protein [Rhodococcus sp. BP22]
MTNYLDTAEEAIEGYKGKLDAIRANTNLSATGRRQQIAAAYDTARETVDYARGKHEWTKQAHRQRLERKVFGPSTKTLTGADAISWRDAQDRAAKLLPTSYSEPHNNAALEAEALTTLNRALQSGDDHLARAIVTVAFDQRWADVANAYSNAVANPDVVVELWNSATGDGTGFDVDEMNFYLDKPKELNLPEPAEPVDYNARQTQLGRAQFGREFADALTTSANELTTTASKGPAFGTGTF